MSLGMVILALMALRFVVRWRTKPPSHIDSIEAQRAGGIAILSRAWRLGEARRFRLDLKCPAMNGRYRSGISGFQALCIF